MVAGRIRAGKKAEARRVISIARTTHALAATHELPITAAVDLAFRAARGRVAAGDSTAAADVVVADLAAVVDVVVAVGGAAVADAAAAGGANLGSV